MGLNNQVWEGTWVTLIWEILNHRSKVVFKNGVVDVEEILCLA